MNEYLARLLAVSFFTFLAGAQTGTDPTFHANSRLVQIVVVAHDKSGVPVAGLTRDDFELLDNGQRQSIASFETATSANTPAATFAARADQPAVERQDPVRGPTVILLDWLNTSVANQMFARSQALKALGALPAGETIQLLELDPGRLHALRDFTTDREQLVRALKTGEGKIVQMAGSNEEDDPSCPGLSQGDTERLRLLNLRIDDTINAFELIAGQLADVPGRKTLIWVTGGFPIPQCDSLPPHFDPAIRALNDASVAVYAVDARGLVAHDSSVRGSMSRVWANASTMSLFADRTGGKLYYNRNDVDAEILKAEDDLRIAYTLGYYRQSDSRQNDDDSRHKVIVRSVKRGVELSYWDSSPKRRQAPPAARNAPLTAKMTRENGTLSVQLHVAPQSIALSEEKGHWLGGAQLATWFVLPDGRQAGDAVLKSITASLTPENRAKLLLNGFDYRMAIPIPQQAVTVKLKLSDNRTGQSGMLSVPVTLVPEVH